jgi:ribose transport system permease protein
MNVVAEAEPATSPTAPVRSSWANRRRLLIRDYGVLAILVGLFIALSVSSGNFLTVGNLSSVVDAAAVPGIAACGVTMAIVSGAFDLSLGAVYALSGIVAIMVANVLGTALGDLAAILLGAVLGLVNGVIIARFKINSFIATLATSFAFTGLAVLITDGLSVSTTASGFGLLGSFTPLADLTADSWVFIGIILVTTCLLHFTGYGRTLFAIGGNSEAARLAGLKVRLDQTIALGISATCAAVAGVLDASRAGSFSSSSGSEATLALTAIAATVIGGTSIAGGEGAIWRAVVGVLVLGLMTDAFTLLGINGNLHDVIEGALILLAVGLDVALRRRS